MGTCMPGESLCILQKCWYLPWTNAMFAKTKQTVKKVTKLLDVFIVCFCSRSVSSIHDNRKISIKNQILNWMQQQFMDLRKVQVEDKFFESSSRPSFDIYNDHSQYSLVTGRIMAVMAHSDVVCTDSRTYIYNINIKFNMVSNRDRCWRQDKWCTLDNKFMIAVNL